MGKHTRPVDSYYNYASSIQTLPVNEFPSSVEWSNDGQAFAITRANIHLWTPLLGYSVTPEDLHQQNYNQQNPSSSTDHASQDTPATPNSASINNTTVQAQTQSISTTSSSVQPHQIPMFTTIIEVDKQYGYNWSAHSNELHIITPPNDDRFWRMASWSPSGLSSLGSCLLAGLTTTCDVFVFAPFHNFQSGLWEMSQAKKNLSEELLRFFFNSFSTIIQNDSRYPHSGQEKEKEKDQVIPERNDIDLDRPGRRKRGRRHDDLVQVQDRNTEEDHFDISPETDWSESLEARAKRSRFTSCVLRTQTTGLAWSPAYSHSAQPQNQCPTQVDETLHQHGCHDLDFSLLALGHRRGDVSLWRHTSNGNMQLVYFNPICTSGLTLNLLSWSDWSLCHQNIRNGRTPQGEIMTENQDSSNGYQLTAYLAIANSKGVVYVLEVSQPFERQQEFSSGNYSPTPMELENSKINVRISFVYRDQLNLSSITAMKWVPYFDEISPPRLVFTRLGEVVFLRIPPKSEQTQEPIYSDQPANHQIIHLPALHPHDDRLCWPNCHSWASCSGLSIIPIERCYETQENKNQVIIMLSNGLIFVLNQTTLNKEPKENRIQLDLQGSIQLSLDFRSKFRNITLHQSIQPHNHNHLGQISKQNLMNVYGSSVLSTTLHVHNQYDQFHRQLRLGSRGSIMSWLYEIDSPNKFCYKPENRQILHFCLADFNPVDDSDGIQNQQLQPNLPSPVDTRRSELIALLQTQIKILPSLFAKPSSCIQVSPNLKLMNVFNVLHLIFSDTGLVRTPSLSELLSASLVELFDLLDSHNDCDDGSQEISHNQPQTELFDDNLTSPPFTFVKPYLIQKLFYNHHLDQLRLKVNLASFLLSRVDKTLFRNLRTRLVDIKVKISRLIHAEILKILARCLLKYQIRLTDNEKTIMSKYNFASKTIDRMPEPTLEQLLEPDEIDHKLLDQDRLLSSFLSRPSSPSPPEEEEHIHHDDFSSAKFKQEFCPACLQPIHFDSLRFAICRTGHVWDRCSVTFKILSMMELKACTNCGRKSMKNDKLVQGVIDQEELEEGLDRNSSTFNQAENHNSRKDIYSNNHHSLFLNCFLDSFVCCPHCGGRWKISS